MQINLSSNVTKIRLNKTEQRKLQDTQRILNQIGRVTDSGLKQEQCETASELIDSVLGEYADAPAPTESDLSPAEA